GDPLASWHEAWKPHGCFVLEEQIDGQTVPWEFDFPSNDGVPGQGGEDPTPWEMLQIMLGWAKELFEKTSTGVPPATVTEAKLADTVAKAADKLGATQPAKVDLRYVVHA